MSHRSSCEYALHIMCRAFCFCKIGTYGRLDIQTFAKGKVAMFLTEISIFIGGMIIVGILLIVFLRKMEK